MDTKSLLYGLVGFFAGGLLVSVAATFERRDLERAHQDICSERRVDEQSDNRCYQEVGAGS